MKHTINKTEQGYVCQAVNPCDTDDTVQRFLFADFSKNNPRYHFIHPNPIPDNSIVDGQDLTEPFLQIFDNGQWYTETEHPLYDNDSKTRMAVAFKHPELMACVDGVFIRKEQIKSPRLEERRKEISQEVKDKVDCHAPYQELSLYMYNGHGTILLQQDIHEIIEIVNRIEQKSIRDEMSMDMLDTQTPVGEIESCLNHWGNKYLITRK